MSQNVGAASDNTLFTRAEQWLLLIVGAVQFVNILDFMMVMPLGPDFARALDVSAAHIGWSGGSYTVAAAVAGIVGAFFLDRFDRRTALTVALLGLAIATALGGSAWDLPSLMVARVLAGVFGGPATALALSVISDCVPPERRGRAMGAVMGAFSVAAVLGVPMALALAHHGDWRWPFWGVGALTLVVAGAVWLICPPMRGHLANGQPPVENPLKVLSNPTARASLATTVTVFSASFAIVPNIAGYLQFNRGWPRDDMDLLYGMGGLVTFFSMRWVGRMVDRFGASQVATVGTVILALDLLCTFVVTVPAIPVMLLFVGFMVGQSTRTVPLSALSSRVPAPDERARFMSAQSAIQNLASSLGAITASQILTTDDTGRLIGMEKVAMLSIALVLAQPVLMRVVTQRLSLRSATEVTP